MNLADLLARAARMWPEADAFDLPGTSAISFAGLDRLSARVADGLRAQGVRPGDRVGLSLPKSIDAVAGLFGILRAGAAYVPSGVDAPPSRTAFVFGDCSVRLGLVDGALAPAIAEADERADPSRLIAIEGVGDGSGIREALPGPDGEGASSPAPEARAADDTAYILYTSGSTGVPKGVTISHGSARSFIDWCAAEFSPRPGDRFSSHAPFHFDLSILDLYVPMTGGATSVLISEAAAKDPRRLVGLMEEERITSWYSTPSVLGLMARFGGLEGLRLDSLRTVLFAGEVMPIGNLRAWKERVPGAAFYNLYGPTETNVCTFLRIPDEIPADRTTPYGIGAACPHYRIRVVDADGAEVPEGVEGELVASGPGLMTGYWNRPDLDRRVFFVDDTGTRWYRTGDIVTDDGGGSYEFRGRRDRMVKRRGYRVELDEIEVALNAHPGVAEVAVVASDHAEDGVRIHAFLASPDGQPLSIIGLKTFCLDRLPPYMVPDRFAFLPGMPKTRTDKVDYVRLREMSA